MIGRVVALAAVAALAGAMAPAAAPVHGQGARGAAVPIAIRVIAGGATTPALGSNTCKGTAAACRAVLDTKAGNCGGPGLSSCQVSLVVQWSLARADLHGGVLCVYWHTSFGSLRRSGEQLIVPPGGDPAGDWTSTCSGTFPLDNSDPGGSATSSGIYQLLRSDAAGSGTVQAYLLRSVDLQQATDFRTALIGQTPVATITFAAGATPTPKPEPAGDPPLADALVDIAKVANGCGGGEAGKPGWLQTFGSNTSTYLNSNNPLGKRYTVDFSDACDLHDAGYSGAKVRDKLNGGIIDYLKWSKDAVDKKFWEDEKKLCLLAIPESAPVARDDCQHHGGKTSFGAESRYDFVRDHGDPYYQQRPQLSGQWADRSGRVPAWTVAMELRTVTASWKTRTGARASFRGTLISYDHDAVVLGFIKVTTGDEIVRGPATLRVTYAEADQFRLEYRLPDAAPVSAVMIRTTAAAARPTGTRQRYAYSVAVKAEATSGAGGLFPSYVQSRIAGSGTAWLDVRRDDGGALGTFLIVHEFLLTDTFPDYKTTLEITDIVVSSTDFRRRKVALTAMVVSSSFSGCKAGSRAQIFFVQAPPGPDQVGFRVCGVELRYENGRPDATDKVTVRVRQRK